ncbi:RNA polymerase sigma factor [Olivibacter jilunii]|uniref:RNA polymerase sigma factor n=1 Tax=Olivibacter jilunii TaxID=985016 RepID=UPI0010305457|nr:sigma-70 family RNA polymerase sigma factor [Olivibacter jilunii]
MQYWDDEFILLNLRDSRFRKDAFDRLFEKYFEPLTGIAMLYLKDRQRSEDVVQEVFIEFYEKKLYNFVESSLGGYLQKLCRNQCLDNIKMTAREVSRINDYIQLFPDNERPNYGEDSEIRKRFNTMYREMHPQQRKAFDLAWLQGKQYDEVAKIMRISKNSVKTHLRLALRFARKFLSDLV